MSQYNFYSPFHFYKMMLLTIIAVMMVVLSAFYYNIYLFQLQLMENFVHEMRHIRDITYKESKYTKLDSINLQKKISTVNKPLYGSAFLIDDSQKVFFAFLTPYQPIIYSNDINKLEQSSKSLNKLINSSEIIVKKFHKKYWKEIRQMKKQHYNQKSFLVKSNKIVQHNKQKLMNPKDWVEYYVAEVSIDIQNKIKEYLRLSKYEQMIDIGFKWLYVSRKITQKEDGKVKHYRIIGTVNKSLLFFESFDHIKFCLIAVILSILLLVFVFLLSINKQFINPSIMLFDYINNDGCGNTLMIGWNKFWQPWFSLTKDRFGLKQKQIHLLENELLTKEQQEK